MEIKFKELYKKASLIKTGEKVDIEGRDYIRADNGYFVDIGNGVTIPINDDDKIKLDKSLPLASLYDLLPGDFLLDDKKEIYLCVSNYEGGEYFRLSDREWFSCEDLEELFINGIYLIPSEAIEIIIEGYHL